MEAVRPSESIGTNAITVELDPDGDGPVGFEMKDSVRLTNIQIEYQPQTTNTSPSKPKPIPNPALVVRDDKPAIYKLDPEILPAAFGTPEGSRLTWQQSLSSAGDVEFLDRNGPEAKLQGVVDGDIMIEMLADGAVMTCHTIKTAVVPKKFVDVRVNIINTVGLPEPGVSTADEVQAAIESVKPYWRQAGIEMRLESSQAIGHVPEGVEVTPLSDGIFFVDVPFEIFDGAALIGDLEMEIPELNTILFINQSASSTVVHVLSVFDVVEDAFAFPGSSANGTNKPESLVFSDELIQEFIKEGLEDMAFMIIEDGDRLTWAHELGHVFRLSHSDIFGEKSPLVRPDDGRNLMTASGAPEPISEDLILRQAEIARKSRFLREMGGVEQ